MSDHVFQDAYARVRSRYSDQAWLNLAPREITDAIYREIRRIDSERSGAAAAPGLPNGGPSGLRVPLHETMIV